MTLSSKRSVTVCAGVSSSGKTTFGLRLAVNGPFALRAFYDAEFSERDPLKPEYSDRLRIPEATSGGDLDTAVCRGWIAFNPHVMFPGRLEEGLEFFCDWMMEVSKRIPGEKLLVVDEIWRYCNPHSLPPYLAAVVQGGRRARLQLLCNTQEPSSLGKIANGMSELVAFHLQSKANLEWTEHFGLNPAEIQTLPALAYVAKNCDTGGELRGKIKL